MSLEIYFEKRQTTYKKKELQIRKLLWIRNKPLHERKFVKIIIIRYGHRERSSNVYLNIPNNILKKNCRLGKFTGAKKENNPDEANSENRPNQLCHFDKH